MVPDETLDDVLGRPRDQMRADRTAAIELERIRAGQLDRTADPPAAPRGGAQRVLPVAIVAKEPDPTLEPECVLGLRHRIDKQAYELRQPRFVGADSLCQLEELIAVIEGEREDFLARRARRGNAMQARERRVLIGPRN